MDDVIALTMCSILSFNLSMNPNNDLPALSTCTTCRFVEDKSNYWTAVMYFKHPNGSFIRVSPCVFAVITSNATKS